MTVSYPSGIERGKVCLTVLDRTARVSGGVTVWVDLDRALVMPALVCTTPVSTSAVTVLCQLALTYVIRIGC